MAVQLGLEARTRWQAGFPRKTSNRTIYSKEFWNHIDLGSSLNSTVVSCGTWGKSLHLFEPWYPAHWAIGGLNELKAFYPKPRTQQMLSHWGWVMFLPLGRTGPVSAVSPCSFQATALWLQILTFWPGPCGHWFPRNCRGNYALISTPSLIKLGSPSPTLRATTPGLLVAGMTW